MFAGQVKIVKDKCNIEIFLSPVSPGAQKPPLNPYADVSSRARGLNFGPSLHLHPNFVNESIEGSGRSTYLWRLARAFFASTILSFAKT